MLETSGSTISDTVGGNTGTLAGSNTFGNVSLVPNNNNNSVVNLGISGTAGAASLANVPLSTTGPHTIEGWIVYSTNNEVLLTQGSDVSNYFICFAGGSGTFTTGSMGFGESANLLTVPSDTLSAGGVYHCVATREISGSNEIYSIFINGDFVLSSAAVTTRTYDTDFAALGGLLDINALNKSPVEPIVVYNYVLTVDQVKAHYDAGNTTDPLISSSANSFGSNRIKSLTSSNMSKGVDIPYTAYVNSGKIVSGVRENPLVIGGMPLSTSLYTDDTTGEYFYALDVIEDTAANFHIDHLRYESFQLGQGRYLSTKKADGKLCWTILDSGREPTVSKELMWNGVRMGVSVNDELIMNNTGFSSGHITQYREVIIGGIPLTVGRRLNKYYLVVSPATSYDIA
tara:strand:+ start:41623 stop:42822 length:1200 start_codon:yes stop_codon:yes gene_type:complete